MTGSVSKSEAARPSSPRNLVVAAVIAGALIGTLIAVFAGEAPRRFVFDNWQRHGTHQVATDDVVVVMIDDESVSRVGSWPWQRLRVAALIDRIAQAGPSAIGIDVYFTEPDPLRPEAFLDLYDEQYVDASTRAAIAELPYGDLSLGDVLASSPTVIARVATEETTAKEGAAPPTYETVEGTAPPGTQAAKGMLTSIEAFDDLASARGFVNGTPDSDGIVRRVPLSIIVDGQLTTSFSVELAKMHTGAEVLRWNDNELWLGDTASPADSSANFEFKMAEYPEEDVISAVDILRDTFDEREIAGKIVIIGVAATGTYDIVATPIGTEVPGALVQAQAVDAILKGNGLSGPAWLLALEVAASLVLFALLLVAAFWGRNLYLYVAGAFALALPLLSFIAFEFANLLFNPAPPLLVGLCAGIALLLARYAQAIRELVDRRIKEAEQQKENDNARELQLRMVPSSERLAELGKRTEIGATLRPAKSVGGDFYDAFELNDQRLLFLVGDVSGKGLGAALFMAFSKAAAKSKFLSTGNRLDAAVMALNDELSHEEDDRMDLTLMVGLIDCQTGAVEFVNAGHENPLLVRADGSVEEIKLRGGPRLRSLDGFPYQIEKFQLSEGDSLIVISDGATDAVNPKGAVYGLEGVFTALRNQTECNARARVADLEARIEAFENGADPADDLTIMAVRYIGE